MSESDDERQKQVHKKELQCTNALLNYLNNPDQLAMRVNNEIKKQGLVPEMVGNRFETGGQSAGQAWANLSTATAIQRSRQGYGVFYPILVRSRRLWAAATEGRQTVEPNTITLMFKDGPAPMYIGSGRIRKTKKAIHGKQISDYADTLNEKRPFYGAPTAQELAPILAIRDAMIAGIIDNLRKGAGII